jgi:hypothetical protein
VSGVGEENLAKCGIFSKPSISSLLTVIVIGGKVFKDNHESARREMVRLRRNS